MHHGYDQKFLSRFNAKFARADGCWNWTASINAVGYGQIRCGDRILLAHRVSCELHKGPIPDGMFVLHRCDNRRCINPDHLFFGTAADNTHDMQAKGRGRYPGPISPARERRHGNCKLSDADVAEIRRRVASGERQSDLRKEYGISSGHISAVVSRKYR